MTTTTSARLAAIATRSATTAALDRDLLDATLRDLIDHLELPADADLRAAVLDAEEACFLALGGDANSAWLAALDAARSAGTAGQQALRDTAHTRPTFAGVLLAVRSARHGSTDLAGALA
ncbi:MAG: hypothetical protein JNN13_04440 [Planctomycetes bacterium]|nr:hypothetical protein [Planctomycetota bacterium]